MLSAFIFCFCCWISFAFNQNKTINVYGISNLQIPFGQIFVAAQRLAFAHINENEATLLPGYTLNLTLLDANEDTTIALQHVFDIMDSIKNAENTNIILPIVLGCPYSALSSITAPALGAMNWSQISSSSTSITLSDSSRFPTFYRTIASDSLQSAGIMRLLEHFKWTKVAIIYFNDIYGIYLTIELMRLAATHPTQTFEVASIAYMMADAESIKSAVALLQSSGIFIAVLLVHDGDIGLFFAELEEQSRWGYPYFYIGVDAWFDDTVIKARKIERFTQGYLGTAPWASHMLAKKDYNSTHIRAVYNRSNRHYQLFSKLWADKYARDAAFLYNLSAPSALSSYGWDAAYSVAYIVQNIMDRDGTAGVDKLLTTSIDVFNDILTNDISFIGITGNVSYKPNGDRDNALFAYGNILNGSISWVGYFSDSDDEPYLNFDAIVWPKGFVERNMTPRSHVLIKESLISINDNLWITFTFFSVLSIVIVLIYIILTFVYSKHKIMRAASWRLNIITCIGCLMAYIYIIIIGFDENKSSNDSVHELNTMCAIQPWLLCISFTLVFMPLFFKTYRISIIFAKILKKTVLSDTLLLFAVSVCVLFDIILLTLFTSISAPQRSYKNGPLEVIDALQEKQYIYAHCRSPDSTVNYTFYGVIGVYKLLQMLFGIYCCLIVSRIGIREIRKFDETSTQLIAVVISISLFILALITIAFLNEYETNWLYSIQSTVILVICNVCLSFNLAPRFIAIFNGKNAEKYKTTPDEEINKYIQQQLEQLFKQNGGTFSMETLKSITERTRDATYTLKTPSANK